MMSKLKGKMGYAAGVIAGAAAALMPALASADSGITLTVTAGTAENLRDAIVNYWVPTVTGFLFQNELILIAAVAAAIYFLYRGVLFVFRWLRIR